LLPGCVPWSTRQPTTAGGVRKQAVFTLQIGGGASPEQVVEGILVPNVAVCFKDLDPFLQQQMIFGYYNLLSSNNTEFTRMGQGPFL
jgi:hypothetical protein